MRLARMKIALITCRLRHLICLGLSSQIMCTSHHLFPSCPILVCPTSPPTNYSSKQTLLFVQHLSAINLEYPSTSILPSNDRDLNKNAVNPNVPMLMTVNRSTQILVHYNFVVAVQPSCGLYIFTTPSFFQVNQT